MDDFLKRRQEARQRAAAFWQSWQWEQPWQASGGCVALVNSGNYLLHHYFPGVFLQAVSDYVVDAGAKFQVAFILGSIGYHGNSSILFHQFYYLFKSIYVR